jgi:type VI secretion system protein ImpL
MEESQMFKAKEAYQQYKSSLSGFAGVSVDKSYAYQLVRDGFEDNPAIARSHLHAANKAMASLRIALNPEPAASREAEADSFWCLLSAPIDLMWRFAVAQTSCHLQELWDREVIVKVQRVRDPRQVASMLFGAQKLAPGYLKTHAAPFVQQSSSRGYYIIERQNASIPFSRQFFDYIQRGERWEASSGGNVRQSYNVSITAYPTGVNAEARIKPYMTQLLLEGPDGAATLDNRQFRVERSFTWHPDFDGSVQLQIMFENLVLTVPYTGYCAFGQFLADFSKGRRVFKAEQFPEQLHELNRLGIRYIEVNYRIPENQINPITRLLSATPGPPPRRIVHCARPGR